ncbi:MAG: amidase [bacterium]|nr:amidase [bacterium]
MSGDLADLSATEALTRFRSLELSPLELLDALIERANATEPVVNAFTDTYFEQAKEQAAAAADAYARGTARPLEGIAIAVKDEDVIAGQRTTMGSKLLEDWIPEETSPLAQRILDAGAIVHARSAAPEFSMVIFTWSFLHGVTRNPWNPAITPGGSSGGSGAALAAGSTTLATGSDIGGSIRIPASMCGVVGFKPPWGRVPEIPPWNRDLFLASGPLAKTVADAALLQNSISGPVAGDMYGLPRLELPDRFPSMDGMRVALSLDLGLFAPDAEVAGAVGDAASQLQELGAEVEPISLEWGPNLLDAAEDHLSFLMGSIMRADLTDGWESRVTPYVREFFERPTVSTEQWIADWEVMDQAYLELDRKVFGAGFDALICPTLTTTVIPANWGHPETGIPASLNEIYSVAMTIPFNVLGRLPVLDIPAGIAPSTGVPVGMQIVGPMNRDDVPFRIGAALEEAKGSLLGRERPPVTQAKK